MGTEKSFGKGGWGGFRKGNGKTARRGKRNKQQIRKEDKSKRYKCERKRGRGRA